MSASKEGIARAKRVAGMQGGSIMSKKDKIKERIEVFEDTKLLYTNDPRLQRSITDSVSGTMYYPGEYMPLLPPPRLTAPMSVSVSRRRTFEAAMCQLELEPASKVAVLNFASGTNPGGGVERGSPAQEESLCRCSTLYPVLTACELLGSTYYGRHRKLHDARYTDSCIYTPHITVFKSDTAHPERLPIGKWRQVDVISCAAPNLRAIQNGKGPGITSDELLELHKARGRKIFRVAANFKVDTLILGAFGCGAFGNPPDVVAQAYREILEEFDQHIPRVEFAIYCTPRDDWNYQAFAKIMR